MNGSSVDDVLRVAQVVPDTEAAGPGRRFALWTQGCSIRCRGCCNPEMFEADGGTARTIDELVDELARVRAIEGVSFLGGEPFEQAAPLARLAQAARELGLTVMVFSGYRLEELREAAQRERGVAELLELVDVLVDGRFEAKLASSARRWIGSSNQRVHHLGDAYRGDPRFHEPDTVELRLDARGLTVNGTPRAARRASTRGR